MDVDHGQLDHVCRRTLDGSVDGVALGSAAQGIIRRTNVAHVTAAASDRLDITMLAGKSDGVAHVFANTRELLEILLDDAGRFRAGNTKSLSKAKGRNAIGDAVIDHFGFAPHLGG